MRRVGLLLIAVALVATGCGATSGAMKTTDPLSTVDISGKWAGTWKGHEAGGYARTEEARADLLQQGTRGSGRFVLHTTLAVTSVPGAVRDAGLTGARVLFGVSGSEVVLRHELGASLFTADLTVEGDRMFGYIRDAAPPVWIELTRVRAAERPVAAAPQPPPAPVLSSPAPLPAPVAPKPPAPVAPEPPAPVAPEPPAPPPPIAVAPAPPPAEPARAVPKEFTGVAEVKSSYFDFDKFDIRAEDAKILEANGEWLKTNAEMAVLIEGHCDERGTTEYNLVLGERRAQAARDYLISMGIEAERISIVSFGAERGVCTEKIEACWAQNRRATFLVKPR